MSNLIIVESPTKARTLSRFLGNDYRIEATMGHIRDLPPSRLGIDIVNQVTGISYQQEEKDKKANELAADTTSGSSNLSLKPEGLQPIATYDFIPQYTVVKDRKKRIIELKKLAQQADRVILATDPDREGEAIAWHVAELLRHPERPKGVEGSRRKSKIGRDSSAAPQNDSVSRIVFHEITKSAIQDALSHPRTLDMQLVDAQQARRLLDRLVGYKLSPLLWNKLGKNWLSAGRVQSVAVRLIVEREREITAFKPEEYWMIEVILSKAKNPVGVAGTQRDPSTPLRSAQDDSAGNSFIARLVKIAEEKADVKNKESADTIIADLERSAYTVARVDTKEVRRQPTPPFTTSTLQQAGANRYGWSAKRTMKTAQTLYEEGFITYHRTDSTNLAAEAYTMVRTHIAETYGDRYVPEQPRLFKTKSKVAQEAHEAIRPTNLSGTVFGQIEGVLGREAQRLYQMIYQRFVACQMSEAIVDQTSVDVIAHHVILRSHSDEESRRNPENGRDPSTPLRFAQDDKKNEPTTYTFRANGQVIKFDGWMAVYSEVKREKEEGDEKEEKEEQKILPPLAVDESLHLEKLLPQQKFTEPPPRYNEASLIKTLEQAGIGRPSTYAPIISTIQDRKYVEKQNRRFHATDLGMTVTDFLVKYFPDIFAVSFTAKMEDNLDEVANGQMTWNAVMNDFYGHFAVKLETVFKEAERVKVDLGTSDEICPTCGSQLVYRLSKFGKFLACSKFPDCKFTKTIIEKAGIPCPKCAGDMILKRTRKGKQFYGCANYPTCTFAAWRKEDIK